MTMLDKIRRYQKLASRVGRSKDLDTLLDAFMDAEEVPKDKRDERKAAMKEVLKSMGLQKGKKVDMKTYVDYLSKHKDRYAR